MMRRRKSVFSMLLTTLLLAGILLGCGQNAVVETPGPVTQEIAADAAQQSAEAVKPTDAAPAEQPQATQVSTPQETAEPDPDGEKRGTPVEPQPEETAAQVSQAPEEQPSEEPAVQASQTAAPEGIAAEAVEVDVENLEDEAVALSESPAAVPISATAVASGTLTKQGADAVIDYSNTRDGYVMVQYTTKTETRLKAQVKGPTTTYTYNLTAQEWAALPLSDGNGTYQIILYKNVTGTKYAAVISQTIQVALADEFAPFLHSNQYVDFDAAPDTVAMAAKLTKDLTEPLEKVEAVYDYVVKGLTYDKKLAATVKSGYLPNLDQVLAKKSGICFDYAALMTGMLRSQEIPCKLVVGYAGKAYHAWISVWSEETGWVDGVIWFNGTSWQRMDPTFASSGDSSESIMAYIGDGNNYSAKYFY